MLISDVERYLALRQKMGFKLLWTSRHLRAFAGVATANGDSLIRSATAVAWATKAGTQGMRHQRLNDLVRLARFLHAENADHEIPPNGVSPLPKRDQHHTSIRTKSWRALCDLLASSM